METEPKARVSQVPSQAEWPKMLARASEDVMRSELHRFEANFGAAFNTAFKTAVDRAITSAIVIASGVIGIGCLMAALTLLLDLWLPSRLSLTFTGLAIIEIGQIIYTRHVKWTTRAAT